MVFLALKVRSVERDSEIDDCLEDGDHIGNDHNHMKQENGEFGTETKPPQFEIGRASCRERVFRPV